MQFQITLPVLFPGLLSQKQDPFDFFLIFIKGKTEFTFPARMVDVLLSNRK